MSTSWILSLRHDVINLVRAFDNVLLLRTLSKGYSLAGLRLGYGVGSPSLIEPMLTKTRDSYNVDAIAQSVACAGFADLDYAANTWAKFAANAVDCATRFDPAASSVPPSQTNFLLATAAGRRSAWRGGVVRGVEVPRHSRALFRRAASRRQTPHQLGDPAQNDRLLALTHLTAIANA